jgi:hypothetical protein
MNREPGEPSPTPGERPHPRSPLAHPSRSPSPTALCSTNRLTLRGSILGPRPARPKWAHTTVSFPGCTAREGKSALNVTLNRALPPPHPASYLLFHQPLIVYYQLRSSALLSPSLNRTLRFHHSPQHYIISIWRRIYGSHHCERSAPLQFQEWIEDDDVGGGKSWVARIIHSCTIRYSLSNSSLNHGGP